MFKDPSHSYRCVCGSLIIVLMRAIPLHRNHFIAHTSTQKDTKAHVRTPSPPDVALLSEASYRSPDPITGLDSTATGTYLHARNALQQCQTPVDGANGP